MEECIPLSDTGQCSRSPPGGDGEEAGHSLHPLPVTFTKVKRPQRGIVVLTELEESSGSSSLVRSPPHYLPLSIIICFLMPPFGIVAVVYSKRCIRDVQNGRIQSSWRHSKTALLLGLGGLLTLCVLFLVLACIYLGIHFTNAYTNQYYFQNKSQNIDTQWTTPKTTTVTETKTTTTTTAVYSTTISIKQTSTAMSFLKTVNQQNYKNFLQLLNSDSRLPSNEDIRKGQEDLKNRDSLIQDFLQYKNISGEKE